jgi:hypothetical protein
MKKSSPTTKIKKPKIKKHEKTIFIKNHNDFPIC